MSQEDYYEPNDEEKKLIRENSVFAGKAIDCAYRAGAISTLFIAKMGNGDQSDAIRHCIWSALIAK